AERIALATLHAGSPPRIPRRFTGNHRRCGGPMRPLLLDLNACSSRELQSGAANAYSIANGLAALLHKIEKALMRIDDNGSGTLGRSIVDLLASIFRVDLGQTDCIDPEFLGIERGIISRAGATGQSLAACQLRSVDCDAAGDSQRENGRNEDDPRGLYIRNH